MRLMNVLFAIDVASRRVEIVGIAANPGGHWMEQMARDLVDGVDGFLVGKRYVLVDRDPLYTECFRGILGQGGVKAVRLPARSPNLNAFAERFVLSIKTE
jgi:putative transposase